MQGDTGATMNAGVYRGIQGDTPSQSVQAPEHPPAHLELMLPVPADTRESLRRRAIAGALEQVVRAQTAARTSGYAGDACAAEMAAWTHLQALLGQPVS